MHFFTSRLYKVSALFVFIFLLATSWSSAQTRVDTGRQAAMTSINLTDVANYFAAHPTPPRVKEIENDDDDIIPVHPAADPARIRYRATTPSPYTPLSLLPVSPAPTDSFEAILDNGTAIPPDTHGAVDSNYCMTTINTDVAVQTRAGATAIPTVSLDNFWSSITGPATYDPRVHYDPNYHRWIFVTDDSAQSSHSCLLIAVSKTSNPTGAWWMYRVDVSVPGYWLDYPNVGFNKNWVVITGNLFAISGSGYAGCRVFAFNYASLMSGAGAPYTAFTQSSSQCITPTLTYDPTLNSIFAVESWDGTASGGGQMQLWKISGPVGSETMTSVSFPASAGYNWQSQGNGGSDFAPQVGSSGLIQTNDDRVFSCVYINNRLWFSHNVFSPASGATTRCSVQWWQIDTAGAPSQIGLIDDPTNTNFYAFPSVAVNSSNDALIGFTQFSSLTHPNAAYALHMHSDPTDSVRPYQVYRHGQNTYFKNFGGSRDRWGDYSGTNVDPLNMNDFWTIQETTASSVNTWDTWWAYINMCGIVATITPGGPTTFCAGGNVVLTGTSGSGLTYQWNLGGTPIVGATNISYTATASGNYTVMITGSCTATSPATTVSVNPAPAAIGGTLSVCVGSTTNLTDASGAGTWSSSAPSVASVVPATGVVTGVASGTATITFTLGTGCYTTAIVTVNPVPAAIGGTLTVCQGSTTTLTDITTPGTWSSGTTAVATVIPTTGVVSGITPGTSVISYTIGTGCTVTATVTVNPVATITGTLSVCSGSTTTLSASIGAGTWNTSNPAVATVSGGVVTGVGTGGLVNISYTLPTGCTSVVVVTVNATTAAAITGPSSVCVGQNITLSDVTPGGAWSSTSPGVATIGTSGIVTGVAAGTTTISYSAVTSCGTATASTTITVNPVPAVAAITGITGVCTGGTTTLSDATPAGVWSSASPAIATVGSTSGIVTGVASGNATISYTVTNGFGCATTATTTVNVFSSFTATATATGSTSFCTGGSVLINGSTGAGYTYQWYRNAAPIAGATASNYTASATGNYTVLETAGSGCNSLSAAVTVSVNPSPIVVPAISISASPGFTICGSGAPLTTFTAMPTNGGTTPTYQWFKNGVATVTTPTYSYVPAVGDVISLIMNSSATCAFPTSVSTVDTMKASALLTPFVSIISHTTPICAGDTVRFSAVPVNGGTAPTYLWTENGIHVATGPDYIYIPHNGDRLCVTMTSNHPCLTVDTAQSSTMMISVQAPFVNTVNVTVSQSSIVAGSVDTFRAYGPAECTAPSFQWLLNGVAISGANSSVYITRTLVEGQVISVIESCTVACAEPSTVESSGVTVHVIPVGVAQVNAANGNYTLVPNPNKGAFTVYGKLSSVADEAVTITITDMLGQAVYTHAALAHNGIVNETITLDNSVANGMYLVNISSGEGREVYHVVVNR